MCKVPIDGPIAPEIVDNGQRCTTNGLNNSFGVRKVTYIADLSEERVAEIKEIFSHYDRNRNNRIEVNEFQNLLIALGGELIEGEVAAGLEALDTNRNGTIEWGEFIAWWARRI